MKTKNNLTTGILLGIGVIVLPLILMSTTNINNTNNDRNRYELYPNESGGGVFRLDTQTGTVDCIFPMGTKQFKRFDINGLVK